MHQLEMRHKLTTAGYPKKLHRQREETVFTDTVFREHATPYRDRAATAPNSTAIFVLCDSTSSVVIAMPRRSCVNYNELFAGWTLVYSSTTEKSWRSSTAVLAVQLNEQPIRRARALAHLVQASGRGRSRHRVRGGLRLVRQARV